MGGSTIGRRPGGVGGVSADVPLVVDGNNKITIRLDPTSLKINEDDRLAVKADIPALIPDHAPPLLIDQDNAVVTLKLDSEKFRVTPQGALSTAKTFDAPIVETPGNPTIQLKTDDTFFKVTDDGTLTIKNIGARQVLFGSGSDKDDPDNPDGYDCSPEFFYGEIPLGPISLGAVYSPIYITSGGFNILNVMEFPDNVCAPVFYVWRFMRPGKDSPVAITTTPRKAGTFKKKELNIRFKPPLNVVDTDDLYANEEVPLDDDTGLPYQPKALTVIHDDTLTVLPANDIENPPGLSVNFHHILDRKTLTYDKTKFEMSVNHDWTLHTYDPQPDNDTTKPTKLASFGVQFDTNTMMKQLLNPPGEFPDPDAAGRLAVRAEGLIDKKTLRIKTTQDASNRPLYLIEVDVKNLIDNQTLNVDTHPDTGEVKIKVDLNKLVDNTTLTTATSQDGLHHILKGHYHGSGGITVDNSTGKISGNYSGGTGISVSSNGVISLATKAPGQGSSAAGDLVKEGVAGSLGGLANSVVSWYANNGTIITMGALAACLGLSSTAIAKAYGGSNGADAFVVIVDEDGNARAFYDHDATGDPGSAYEGTELVNFRTLQQEIQKAIDNGNGGGGGGGDDDDDDDDTIKKVELDMSDRNIIIAHRFGPLSIPIYSLSNVERLIQRGRLKYIEFDVCRTNDGVWYLSHYNMEEYESSGSTSEQLRKGHLKSGWSHLFDGQPLPTLREAWDALRKYPQVIIFLELKNGDPVALLNECRAIGLTPDRMVFSDFDIPQVMLFKTAGYLTVWTVNNATHVQAQDPTTYDHLCCSHDQLSTMYPVADNLEKHLFLYTLDSPHQWKTYREQYERVVGAYADAPVPVSQWYRSFAPYQWECLDPLNGYVSTKLYYGAAGKPRFARYDWIPEKWAARLSVAGSSDNLDQMYGAVFHNYHLDATVEGRVRLDKVGIDNRWFGVLLRMFDTYEVDDQPGSRPAQINILFRANRVVDVYTRLNSNPTKVATANHTLTDSNHFYFRIERQVVADTVELSVYLGNTRSELAVAPRLLLYTFTNVTDTPWLSLGHLTLLSNGVNQGYIEYYVPKSPVTNVPDDNTHYMEYRNIETTCSMNVGSKAVNATNVTVACTNRNKHASAYAQVRLVNDTDKAAFLLYNSSLSTGNGGPNALTLRNLGGGPVQLQADNVNGGIVIEPTTGDVNIRTNLKVKGAPIGALAHKTSLDWNSDDIINKPTLATLDNNGALSVNQVKFPLGTLSHWDNRDLVFPPAKFQSTHTSTFVDLPYGNGTYDASASSSFYVHSGPGGAFGYAGSGGSPMWRTPLTLYSITTGEHVANTTTSTNLGDRKGEWLQLQLPEPILCKKLTLTTLGTSASPASYVLCGSLDGLTWNVLFATTDVNPNATQTATVPTNNVQPCAYLRLIFLSKFPGQVYGDVILGTVKFTGDLISKNGVSLDTSLNVVDTVHCAKAHVTNEFTVQDRPLGDLAFKNTLSYEALTDKPVLPVTPSWSSAVFRITGFRWPTSDQALGYFTFGKVPGVTTIPTPISTNMSIPSGSLPLTYVSLQTGIYALDVHLTWKSPARNQSTTYAWCLEACNVMSYNASFMQPSTTLSTSNFLTFKETGVTTTTSGTFQSLTFNMCVHITETTDHKNTIMLAALYPYTTIVGDKPGADPFHINDVTKSRIIITKLDMTDTYLSMLAELGINVSTDEWNSAHNVPDVPGPRSPPLLPSQPAYYDSDDDNLPIFTSSQIAWCDPETFGYHRYCVVEDEETAHPMVMDYQDEQQWKMNRQRTHHYDRLYRIRRTFFQLLGHATTKVPPTLEAELKKHIHGSTLMSRNIYEVIRKYLKQRKLPHLYPAIPLLISRLGGPRWNVPYHKVQLVLEDAFQLHRTFDYLKKQGSLGRQRFPKYKKEATLATPFHHEGTESCAAMGKRQAQDRPDHTLKRTVTAYDNLTRFITQHIDFVKHPQDGRRLSNELFYNIQIAHTLDPISKLQLFNYFDRGIGRRIFFWAHAVYTVGKRYTWINEHIPLCPMYIEGFPDELELARRIAKTSDDNCPTKPLEVLCWKIKPHKHRVQAHDRWGNIYMLRHHNICCVERPVQYKDQ
ncbi:hypothetical protein HDU85_006554 [Gaertneriomyces sp. JEL0708]|nr:hypothetical protein HDU85_006554 [Gaertneriomyces sp. JEL0708]